MLAHLLQPVCLSLDVGVDAGHQDILCSLKLFLFDWKQEIIELLDGALHDVLGKVEWATDRQPEQSTVAVVLRYGVCLFYTGNSIQKILGAARVHPLSRPA